LGLTPYVKGKQTEPEEGERDVPQDGRSDRTAKYCPSTTARRWGWAQTGVSNSEMRIFRQYQGNQESTRLRGDVACRVAQVIPQIDAEIGEIDRLWMETN